MVYYIAGDIGGTNSRLQLISTSSSSSPLENEKVVAEHFYPSHKHQSMEEIVSLFLREYAPSSSSSSSGVVACCLAVAGPVANNKSRITNLPWLIDGEEIKKKCQIPQVALINDFAGVGYGLLGLGKGDLLALQERPSEPKGPKCCIGAGTGLGEVYLTSGHLKTGQIEESSNLSSLEKNTLKDSEDYFVFSSEGGHTDFAARSEEEWAIFRHFQKTFPQIGRMSVERVVSGSGIPTIYGAFDALFPGKADENIRQKVLKGEGDVSALISKAAVKNQCPLCVQVMDTFVQLYAAEAGNLALKLIPTGGLYIAGGIITKILPLVKKNDQFLRHFLDKGRMKAVLEKLPVFIVTNQQVGLLGARVMAKRLLKADVKEHQRAKL